MKSLTLVSVDSGFCRVYYRSDSGCLMCFQNDFRDDFTLYVCTKDGEPEYESTKAHSLDKLPEPSCPLADKFNKWVEAKGTKVSG